MVSFTYSLSGSTEIPLYLDEPTSAWTTAHTEHCAATNGSGYHGPQMSPDEYESSEIDYGYGGRYTQPSYGTSNDSTPNEDDAQAQEPDSGLDIYGQPTTDGSSNSNSRRLQSCVSIPIAAWIGLLLIVTVNLFTDAAGTD